MNDWFIIELAKMRSNEIERELAMIRLAKMAATEPTAASIKSIKSIPSIVPTLWSNLLALTGNLFLNCGAYLVKHSDKTRRVELC